MSEIKIIKTKEDHVAAIALMEELISADPTPDSEEGEKLKLLAKLIEDYESELFPQSFPTPVEAIRFRMEQQNLIPADLIPYIGSRSRVSEVLSGKRALSLEMIRALESGLDIPAEVLIRKASSEESPYRNWSDLLIKEMDKRNYFSNASFDGTNKENVLSSFFSRAQQNNLKFAWRKTHSRTSVRTDEQALIAWAEHIQHLADQIKAPVEYIEGTVDLAFMKQVGKLSVKENGPVAAQKYLLDHGVILVVARHLPKTKVDGVTLLTNKKRPVIGLSLRFDRLDNFWFTLLHELAHVSLHLHGDEGDVFFDELEDAAGATVDKAEKEADTLAQEALIPENKWAISPAKITPSPMAAQSLATELGIHVTVVAGIIRHKHQNYFYLNKVVNSDDARVRKYFPDAFPISQNI